MIYEGCNPVNASFYGPSLLDICAATTFFAFIGHLQAEVGKVNEITGACERVTPVEIADYEYDFVVVGGGAGGSVVASRLSENPKWKVLLLEAGPDEPVGTAIPSFATQFKNTNIVWSYNTNESVACQSRNYSCPCPSGKNLGGNTAHNGMIYLRGNPTDFNNWEKLGNKGWAWEDVVPFYKKSEDNGEIDRVGTEYHGTGGPLGVGRFSYLTPMGSELLKAAEEVGLGVTEDNNGEKFTGFAWVQSTQKDGVRSSASRAFLRPARNRKNLHVSLDSHVTKILFENKKAIGVEYFKDGELRKVYVKKEVIVSGGAMNSPQILLLSGIGPKKHLESVGVPVVLDLPGVGQNFHDHPGIGVTFTVNDEDTYENNVEVALEYIKNQTGPMSAAGTIAVVGVVATDMTTIDYPDTQLFNLGYVPVCAPGEVNALRSDGKRTIFTVASNVHPRSRGTVTLASNNPFDYPILRANYQQDPIDLQRQVKGLQLLLSLVNAEVLKPYNFTMIPVEACSTQHELYSDEYFACVALYDNFALYHFAGSCKMGPASDPLAVVDSELRVHGLEGIRVVDASIMPQVTSSNTQAPTMMIGERGADFIKQTWSSYTSHY